MDDYWRCSTLWMDGLWMVYGWFIMENPMKNIKINDLSHY